jgi:hypothetical protein
MAEPDRPLDPSLTSASSARRRRLRPRRKYQRSIGAAREMTVDELEQLPHEQRHRIYLEIARYQSEAHIERLDGLTPRRRAAIAPALDQIEREADAEGWPEYLMNRSRPFLRRDADGKLLPIRFGVDIDPSGRVTQVLPKLARTTRKPLPPAPHKPVAESFDDLEFTLRRSIELAQQARDRS